MSKDEKIYFRIDNDIKTEIQNMAKENGFTVSKFLRNKVSSLVNRKDEIDAITQRNKLQLEEIELFLENEEINDFGKNDKDEIIYHCNDCKNDIILMKFTRKSNKFQSSFDVLKFGKSMLKCGEALYLAVGSSSFYDTAFLRCIEFCRTIKISIVEVIALTRSEYETITRSVLIADKVASKISEYHISLKGIDIMMLRIHCVISQNDQIRRMNTTYSLKTDLFFKYLNDSEQEAKDFYEIEKSKGYKKFKERSFDLYKREYKALYELNNLDKDKFNYALLYLISNKLE